ncbi:MAG: PQQ-dependent sugar dehydrogenase, partial [Chloroflexota bacterium]|nr:PQQ-dependent sugar dehydrogenase [Chloroflexota bacterium]
MSRRFLVSLSIILLLVGGQGALASWGANPLWLASEAANAQGQQGTPTPTAQTEFDTVEAPIEETRPIGLQLVAEGMTSPNHLVEAPDESGRLFVTDQTGQIWIIDEDGTLLDEPFLDLSDRLVELNESYDERGLLGLAFHPDYADNGRFFVYYSAPLRDEAPEDFNHTSHISEFSVSEDEPNQADPDSEQILLQVDQPQGNHNGGMLAFGPEDGYLYIALGDGGGANDVGTGHVEDWYDENEGGNGQDVRQNLLGSLLRIDVDNGDPYAIPEDNPTIGRTEQTSEQYAYGFRNPFRFSFDMAGEHELFLSDAGQNMFEEVNIVRRAGNYGWNVMEGTHCFSTETPNDPPAECPDSTPWDAPLELPIIEYLNANQENGVGTVVVGGYVYRGEALDELDGAYLFGDWGQDVAREEPDGVLMMATRPDDEAEEGLWPVTKLEIEGSDNGELQHFVLGFGQDSEGEVYVLADRATGPEGMTGVVLQIVPPGEGMTMSELRGEVEEEAEATPTPEAAEVVDCDGGETISMVLERASPGDTIGISGTCNETIVITTDGLTLMGENDAIIDGGDTDENVVTIDGARDVTLTGLTIQNGNEGILAIDGATLEVTDTVVQDNNSHGIELVRASAEFTNVVSQQNGRAGLIIARNSLANLTDSTLQENLTGLVVFSNSTARLFGANQMSQNETQGFTVGLGGTVFSIGSEITASDNGA